jgi:hypothetical protein
MMGVACRHVAQQRVGMFFDGEKLDPVCCIARPTGHRDFRRVGSRWINRQSPAFATDVVPNGILFFLT